MSIPSRSTRTVIERVFAKIPAVEIGEIYCDEGGEAWFETMRPRIVDDGIEWAEALAPRLAEAPGASLYVGAGLAELAAMLVEALDLGRRVVAANLREAECACLNRALHRAEVDRRALEVLPLDASEVDAGDGVSHLSCVSVLSDPETWPVVSGVGYGRIPPVLLDVPAFQRERKAIRAVVDALGAKLTLPALVTTTGEETAWFLDWADRHEVSHRVEDVALRAAVVGDPIGFLWLGASRPAKGRAEK